MTSKGNVKDKKRKKKKKGRSYDVNTGIVFPSKI